VISLSPFVNTGLIIEYFNLLENTPEERERHLLKIYVKEEIIKGTLIFRILIGISS
jgi:hypothetical protein